MDTLTQPVVAGTGRQDPPSPHGAGRLRRLVVGRPRDPRWARPALLALLGTTALLYLWGLGASGWANSFYSAAVQAGTKSWKAFFFGSSDAANFITVDKPPAALWVMELSARVFGLNAWSILVPQALEGVAAVGLLYASVRRWSGAAAGLVAGAVLALTPVAALMFRFNNPDALLVLLLTGAAYGMVRALGEGRTRWLVVAGCLIGTGFLAKMLQTVLVVPGFALAYLIAGPVALRRRIVQLLAGAGAMVVSALWWVVAVMAVPASARPYIGGSQNNSLWNLMFGYNGFGRLTGNEAGSVGGGAAATGSRWGATGLFRMFNTQFGAQSSWLIPAALIFLAAGLVVSLRAGRTDRLRASLVIWGGWLVMTAAAFSLGRGIIHPYYTVALAPATGALVGIGGWSMWRLRHRWEARVVLAVALGVTAVWSYVLLARTPGWNPWLRDAVLIGGLAVSVLIAGWTHMLGKAGGLVAAAAVLLALLGPGAYSVATAATTHRGAIPTAGPTGAGGFGAGGFGGALGGRAGSFAGRPGSVTGAAPGGLAGPRQGGSARSLPQGGFRGGAAGLLNGSTPNAALTAALKSSADRYTWVAATIGSNQASGYQLAAGKPVMAIGGFNGTDPAPTLAEFQKLVAAGRIHYFIGGGRFGGGGGSPDGTAGASVSSASSEITAWVESHFTSVTIGGAIVYDLTPATSS
jgi:4-amino-4-deoxy-L-arabinose transferase-like glycosyltransferase